VAGLFSTSLLSRLVSRMNLRHPTFFRVLVVVTLLDFVVPDVLPFADEIALSVLTVLVSQWKDHRAVPAPPEA